MPRCLHVCLVVVLLVLPAASLRAEEGPEEKEFRLHLRETKVSVQVANEAFGDVVKLLRLQTAHNIQIDPRIESDVYENVVTGLDVEDLPLETVLDLLAASGGEEATWILRGNTVVFTSREYVRERLPVRIYPVGALVAGRVEFEPPPPAGVVGGPDSDEEARVFYPLGTIDELIELTKSAVFPTFWEETEGADIRSLGEARLVVRASARVHAAIERYLAHLHQLTAGAVLVEVHAVQPTRSARSAASAVSDAEVEALLVHPAAGPFLRLAVREGLQSTAFVGQRRTYIEGYDARGAGESWSTDPRIGVVEVGMGARIRALTGPERERILLKLDVGVAELTPERTHGDASDDQVLLPGRTIVRRTGVTLVEPGAWHWAEGSTGGTQGAGWGFLVRATPIRGHFEPEPPFLPLTVPDARSRLSEAHSLAETRLARVRWEGADLDGLVSYLRGVTGLNFFVTPRARDEVLDDMDTKLHLEDVSADVVLDLVTEPFGLAWRVTDGLVTIDLRQESPLPAFAVPDSRPTLPAAHPLVDVRLARVQWEGASLDEVVSHLAARTGLNFFITPRVRDEVFDEIAVDLLLKDAYPKMVLDLVTEPFELGWRLTDGLVTIYRPESDSPALALRYFDVKDLVERIQLGRVGARSGSEDDIEYEEVPIYESEALVELIRESVGSERDWEDPASIEVRNGIIIARSTPAVLDTVDRMLRGLRASRRLVVTTVDHVRMGAATARELLGDGAGRFPVILGPAAVAAIERALADGSATCISGERIASLEGAGAPAAPEASGREVAYVADYDVGLDDEGHAGMAVPLVKTLLTGTRIELRALPGYPGDHVYLELVVESTELSAMDEDTTRFGPIGLPVTDVWSVSTGFSVPAGRTAALFASGDADGGHVLLVTPTRVPPERHAER